MVLSSKGSGVGSPHPRNGRGQLVIAPWRQNELIRNMYESHHAYLEELEAFAAAHPEVGDPTCEYTWHLRCFGPIVTQVVGFHRISGVSIAQQHHRLMLAWMSACHCHPSTDDDLWRRAMGRGLELFPSGERSLVENQLRLLGVWRSGAPAAALAVSSDPTPSAVLSPTRDGATEVVEYHRRERYVDGQLAEVIEFLRAERFGL